jgi:RNA polymerase primary sigma factor
MESENWQDRAELEPPEDEVGQPARDQFPVLGHLVLAEELTGSILASPEPAAEDIDTIHEYVTPKQSAPTDTWLPASKKTEYAPEVSNETLIEHYRLTNSTGTLEQLIKQNIGLVRSIVNRMPVVSATCRRGGAVGIEDFEAEGMMAVMKAVDTFKPELGYKFSTHASLRIVGRIKKLAATSSHPLYQLPAYTLDTARRADRHIAGGFASVPIASQRALRSLYAAVSLDTVPYDESPTHIPDEDAYDIGIIRNADMYFHKGRFTRANLPYSASLTTVNDGDDIDRSIEEIHANLLIEDLLHGLDNREREVVDMRFGLITNDAKTLEEVGRLFDMTRERIRQIEARALAKMRDPRLSIRLHAKKSAR